MRNPTIPAGTLMRIAIRWAAVSVAAAALVVVGSSTTALADDGQNAGIGTGNQVEAPVQAPVEAGCNAIGVLGDASASCKGGAEATQGGPQATPPAATSVPPTSEPKPTAAPVSQGLPVTGSAVTGMIAVAVVLLGLGGAALFLVRRRSATR